MGTNYYLHNPTPCPTCGHDPSPVLHIGKSSGGWCFSLHVIPEDGINTLDDWRERWQKGVIRDEYGMDVTTTEMDAVITLRHRDKPCEWTAGAYEMNYAEPGPFNLVRHSIKDRHCIGHGEGTWDYITGDFS